MSVAVGILIKMLTSILEILNERFHFKGKRIRVKKKVVQEHIIYYIKFTWHISVVGCNKNY